MQTPASPSAGRIQCALYLRISKDRRKLSLGVERQEEACRALAEQLGWDIHTVFSENDLSAYSGKRRPLYSQMLDLMKTGHIQGVIALHTDRLHRSPTELEEFITICDQNRIDVRTVQAGIIDLSSPTGRMGARIYGAVARHEVEHGIERMKAAKLQAAKAGKINGGNRAYGWNQDGMTLNEAEAPVVKEIVERFIAGESWNKIALDLNARSIPTARGKKWAAINVSNVAQLKRHYGIREHNGNEYEASWAPLLSRDTWDNLQLAIKRGQATYGKRSYSRTHLLTGFVFCGLCGNRMKIINAQQRDGSYSPAFACVVKDHRGEKVGCGGVKRKKDPVESLVIECLMYRLDTPDLTAMLGSKDSDDSLKQLVRDHELQSLRLQEILDLYSKGELTFSEYRTAKTTAQDRLDALSRELDQKASRNTIGVIPAGQSVQTAWDKADLEWRRQLLDAVVEKVLIYPKQKGDGKARYKQWIFNPDRVEISWKA